MYWVMRMKRNMKFNDLTGKRFGKLVCIRQGEFCGNHRTWVCKCDCGKIHQSLSTNLLTGKIKSCGCLGSSNGKENVNWRGYEEISGVYWNGVLARAKFRKIPISISIKEAWDVYLRQKKSCALSGIPLSFSKCKKEKSKATASLDRIDSFRGYDTGNVQWVHKDINKMKMDLNQLYFLELCEKIVAKASECS